MTLRSSTLWRSRQCKTRCKICCWSSGRATYRGKGKDYRMTVFGRVPVSVKQSYTAGKTQNRSKPFGACSGLNLRSVYDSALLLAELAAGNKQHSGAQKDQ